MPANKPKPAKTKKSQDPKDAQAYDHKNEKLLLRPDVGLQPQFKQKKLPKTSRYDPSLDPALSWDGSADRANTGARSLTLLQIDVTDHLVGRLV